MGKKSRKVRIRSIAAVIAALTVLGLFGYHLVFGFGPRNKEDSTQVFRILMDTVVDMRVDGPDSARLAEEALGKMARLEQLLSRFVESSDVARLNRRAGEWVTVKKPTLDLIGLALEAGALSEGAFDITIGAVMDLWGFGREEQQVPEGVQLQKVLATVDYSGVEVDPEQSRVRIPAGTVLDLGGIAKGFIVEQAIAFLRENSVSRAIINAGGDISVIGSRPDGEPWRVGVEDPDLPGDVRWILPLTEKSVVTSGDYQRYFIQDGQRWHHLLDPRRGFPAEGLRSVTIVCPNAAWGDALSTAVFVLGLEKGRELVESLAEVEAILVSPQEVWISSGLRPVVNLVKPTG